MKKDLMQSAIKWVMNTMVDIDKIADHYGFRGEDRKKLIKVGTKLREERNKLWETKSQSSPE
jgi:hypothetical protein